MGLSETDLDVHVFRHLQRLSRDHCVSLNFNSVRPRFDSFQVAESNRVVHTKQMELFVKGCAAVRDRMSLMVMVTVIVMMMMVMVMVVMMMLMRTMMMRDEPGITGWNHLTGTTLMRICLMISVSCRRWLRRPARVIPAHYAGPQKPTLAFLVLHLPSSSEVHRSVSLSNRPRFVLAEYTLWWNRFPPVSHFCFFFLCFLFEKSRKRLAGC